MSVRSLNKVMLIGNLTRDPELRYTPSGTAVCSFGVATNRAWTTDGGEKKEEAEFHRIVSWNKLAELCSQLLSKGRKVFVEGRLQTRSWQAPDGAQRSATEIVIDDMIILDSRGPGGMGTAAAPYGTPAAGAIGVTPAKVKGAQEPVSPKTTPVVTSSAEEVAVVDKVQSEPTPATKVAAQGATPAPSAETKTDSAKPKEDINPDDIPF